MDSTLDKTTLSTINLLEARVLRVEQLLYGPASSSSPSPKPRPQDISAVARLADIERRFAALTSRIRVYGDILKIYRADPALFHPPHPAQPPRLLDDTALLATIMSLAPSFASTASALTAIVQDHPIPDAASSAVLVELLPRMRAIEATQLAQAAEVAELRARSEAAVRTWYEGGIVGESGWVADMESRVGKVEGRVRRTERVRRLEKEERY